MRKKPLNRTIISLFLSIAMLIMATSSVMAWFIMSKYSNVNDIDLSISDKNIRANLNINGSPATVLDNIIPGNSFLFTINIQNLKDYTVTVRLFFTGLSQAKYKYSTTLEKEIPMDLLDVLMIGMTSDDANAYYFRTEYNASTNKVEILTGDAMTILPHKSISVNFYLIFSGEHFYFVNDTQPLESGDINIFQDEEFKVSQLIIDVV